MSEVIEEYIRRSSGMNEEAAFEGFLQQDRIKAWVGTDTSRRERLHREFTRVWASLHPPSTPSRQGSLHKEKPAQVAAVPITVRREEAPAVVEVPPQPKLQTGPPRRLQVLCPVCSHMEVWLQGGDIACRHCGREFADMLTLIPVKAVGPFTYMFGEGIEGVLKAAGVVAGLALLYVVLRWSG